ncbi:hypothetical protein EPI10_023413 [Gossypium australe]|uniref:Uncharacterized protein n=1 Tax=Gossypium australe TaxID=47621 RepID=A0A5B6VU60_9ROSI|nr:hypothetical protein EPI10_023413 [Gossypium australe]
MTRSMLHKKNLPKQFWAKPAHTTISDLPQIVKNHKGRHLCRDIGVSMSPHRTSKLPGMKTTPCHDSGYSHATMT